MTNIRIMQGEREVTRAIRSSWKFEPVEVVKETEKMVFYVEHWRGRPTETRQGKKNFLPWRGDEETARAMCAKLTSALAEYERRRKAANEWFATRKAEIIPSLQGDNEQHG